MRKYYLLERNHGIYDLHGDNPISELDRVEISEFDTLEKVYQKYRDEDRGCWTEGWVIVDSDNYESYLSCCENEYYKIALIEYLKRNKD